MHLCNIDAITKFRNPTSLLNIPLKNQALFYKTSPEKLSDTLKHVFVLNVYTGLKEYTYPLETEVLSAGRKVFRHVRIPETCSYIHKFFTTPHPPPVYFSQNSQHSNTSCPILLLLSYLRHTFLSCFPAKIVCVFLFPPHDSYRPRLFYFAGTESSW
jgi:hypothetical protein